MKKSFVHLNVHSDMSISEGIGKIKSLVTKSKELGLPALGLTDVGNCFGAIKFYSECRKQGLKPIIGAEVTLAGGSRISLLCKNLTGYKNLSKLLSLTYDNRRELGKVVVTKEMLSKYSEGLFCLSGGRKGSVGISIREQNYEEAKTKAACLKKIFGGNYLLEVQRLGYSDDDVFVQGVVSISKELGIPLVATNGVQFINLEDSDSHDIRIAIATKSILTNDRLREIREQYSRQQYLKSPEEMVELFSDLPSAIENTVRVAQACNLEIELGKNYLPEFPVPEGMTEARYLKELSRKGLEERLEALSESGHLKRPRPLYYDRLQYELQVIEEMGFPGYFLIVADFIVWSKNNGVPVGPGRGSGAGSLVAYALGITDLDPLEYDLLFERFLNPERVSMPDFDIDFCMDKRDRVIDYVSEKYGRSAVSQIITYGTMAARSVVRDAARALGHPYGVGNRIAQAIPGEPGTTLSGAMETQDDLSLLYETDSDVREIIDHALKLEGVTRQVGKHAGGVLIAPGELTEFTPTYRDPDSFSLVSQYDKDDVEKAGLVKFDFLGLRTLTIIDNAIKQIKSSTGQDIDISRIDLADPEAYKLLKKQETTAVFQLESSGMKGLIKRLQPDTIEEVIALVALYRPGPLQAGMVDDFVNRKHGRSEIEYLHPKLEPILKTTYGVFVYQEQVMQTAQTLAGYTLGQADMLRRAMGKKKPEEMMKQKQFFVDGCIKNGIEESKAEEIFNLMEKFAGYGFNKSHSAAYAYIAYQTAWLKAHYPAEFMSAVLSSDMDNTDKVVMFLHECNRMGIKVLPPNINKSQDHFTVNSEGAIVFGLGAVKGIGSSALKNILSARSAGGEFKSLTDFFARVDGRVANKRVIESAIKSGAFDCFGLNRAELMSTYQDAKDIGKQANSGASSLQGDLFGGLDIDSSELIRSVAAEPWTEKKTLENEREVLGLYLTSHPFKFYKKEIQGKCTGSLSNYIEVSTDKSDEESKLNKRSESIRVSGLVVDKVLKNYGSRGTSAILKLDDGTAQIDVVVYSKTYGDCYHILEIGTPLFIDGLLKYNEKKESYNLIARDVRTIEMVRSREIEVMQIKLGSTADLQKVKDVVSNHDKGHGVINCLLDGQVTEIDEVPVTDNFIHELASKLGRNAVTIKYRGGAEVSAPDENEKKMALLEEGKSTRAKRAIELESAFSELRMAL